MKGQLLLAVLFLFNSQSYSSERIDKFSQQRDPLELYSYRFSYDNSELIYGSDDRYEVAEYSSKKFQTLAQSVALKVPSNKLSIDRDNPKMVNFLKKKLKQVIPQICPSERFTEQLSLGECSGFLVSPTKLVTAGHCMLTDLDCSNNKWVFDFKADTTVLKKENIYSCKKIIAQKYVYSKFQVNDYAVIELDRPVQSRAALEYRTRGFIKHETPLVVIGHPLGLPMKISDGGRVTGQNDQERETPINSAFLKRNYFTANLDTFAGNSGSPVFNFITGQVEGILIQGADDFVFDQEKRCLVSKKLSNNNENSYEKVMRINHVPGL